MQLFCSYCIGASRPSWEGGMKTDWVHFFWANSPPFCSVLSTQHCVRLLIVGLHISTELSSTIAMSSGPRVSLANFTMSLLNFFLQRRWYLLFETSISVLLHSSMRIVLRNILSIVDKTFSGSVSFIPALSLWATVRGTNALLCLYDNTITIFGCASIVGTPFRCGGKWIIRFCRKFKFWMQQLRILKIVNKKLYVKLCRVGGPPFFDSQCTSRFSCFRDAPNKLFQTLFRRIGCRI